MAGARIQNIDALLHFRAALIKFADSAKVALGDAESEVQRTAAWLAGEQQQFWESQIRKRHEIVNRCKDAVRQKKLFKDSAGRTQTAVDEEKALRKALARHEEAELKLRNTKRHSLKLAKELHMYKGATQTFATCLASDVPNAIGSLDRMMRSLQAYVSLTASSGLPETPAPPTTAAAGGSEGGGAMTRSEFDALMAGATPPAASGSPAQPEVGAIAEPAEEKIGAAPHPEPRNSEASNGRI